MAVDTRNKRASVLGIALAIGFPFPNPDGTIDQADRQHIAYCYPGISAGEPVADVGAGRWEKKRYILPDGKVYTNRAQALDELQKQLTAEVQEKPKKKRKSKSRSIHPKKERIVELPPLPNLIANLPQPRLEKLDKNLLEAVQEQEEEEAIIAILHIV